MMWLIHTQAFGIWATNPPVMDLVDAQYCESSCLSMANLTSYPVCSDEWNHDSWNEIVALIIEIRPYLCLESLTCSLFRSMGLKC